MARLRFLFMVLVVTLVAFGTHVANAQTTVVADRFDLEYTIQSNGTVLVSEAQTIHFTGSSATRGFREIPLDRIDSISDVRVSEPGQAYQPGNGAPYTYSVQRQNGVVRVDWWFPPTTNATRTFVLEYAVTGVIRIYEGGDQLRWNAVYQDRGFPVEATTAKVNFPADVTADQVMMAAYPTRIETTSRLISPRTAEFVAGQIPAQTGLEIRVQFPHGLVSAPAPSWQAAADREDWIQENFKPVLNLFFGFVGLVIPVAGLAGLFILWYQRGRDPDVGNTPAELKEPPSDIAPALAGTLVDEHADVQDVIATLADLGNRGIITISQEPASLFGGRDYRLELVQPNAKLLPHEQALIKALFRQGDSVRLSDAKAWFNAHIPVVQAHLYKEVVELGYFPSSPEKTRNNYRAVGFVVLVIGVIGAFLGTAVLSGVTDVAFLPFGGIALVGLGLVILASKLPKRTPIGAREAARWQAFRRYLERARPDQGENGQEAISNFNRYLPYAIALGTNKQWVERFSQYAPRPQWYQPGPVRGGWGWPGPIIIPTPGYGRYRGGTPTEGGRGAAEAGPFGAGGGIGSPDDWSAGLGDLLDRASDVLGHGGGSGWSGGGAGGGWSGGGGGFGGGGGSGGGSGGFS